MKSTRPSMIHMSILCNAPLKTEVQECIKSRNTPDTFIHLVSVGGGKNLDIPMSGGLLETPHLQACPQLKTVLSCFIPALARVCLVHHLSDEPPESSPLFQNSAHSLFYQTVCISLGDKHFLLVEVQQDSASEDVKDEALFDHHRLHALTQIINKLTAPDIKLIKPQLDILTPTHIKLYISTILEHSTRYIPSEKWNALHAAGKLFIHRWQSLFDSFGRGYAGEWSYQSALNYYRANIRAVVMPFLTRFDNDERREEVYSAINIINAQFVFSPPAPQRIDRSLLRKAQRRKQFKVNDNTVLPHYEKPIFIVSTPRAGSTLLFETLSQFTSLWSTGEENHALLEDIMGLHPMEHGFESNRLSADNVNEHVQHELRKAFTSKLQNHQQHYYLDADIKQRPSSIRFLEKTPKNALRVPFFKALFPDALFVYLHRDYESNVSSLIDGWRSQRFISYRNIPGFESRHWSFLLTPGWRTLHDKSIADIARSQWETSNRIIQEDLAQISSSDWLRIDYQTLISNPAETIRQFAKFAALDWDDSIQARCQSGLPVSRLTLSAPQADKWLKHKALLEHTTGKTAPC